MFTAPPYDDDHSVDHLVFLEHLKTGYGMDLQNATYSWILHYTCWDLIADTAAASS